MGTLGIGLCAVAIVAIVAMFFWGRHRTNVQAQEPAPQQAQQVANQDPPPAQNPNVVVNNNFGNLMSAWGWLIGLALALGAILFVWSQSEKRDDGQDLKISQHDTLLMNQDVLNRRMMNWTEVHEKANADSIAALRVATAQAKAQADSALAVASRAQKTADAANAQARKALKLSKAQAEVQLIQKSQVVTQTPTVPGKKGKKKGKSLQEAIKDVENALKEAL